MEQDENTQNVELELQNNESDDSVVAEDVDYKSEAAKWRAIAQRNRNKSSQPLPNNNRQESIDDDVKQTVTRLSMIEEKRQYGYENGLSPEETDFVFKFGGNKPSKEILEDTFVKAGLEGFRASKRLAANTPSSSSRSMSYQGKEFHELPVEDRAKIFEERMKSVKK